MVHDVRQLRTRLKKSFVEDAIDASLQLHKKIVEICAVRLFSVPELREAVRGLRSACRPMIREGAF